jgi:predicted MPP superfamily phosphohydrolase
VIDNVQFAGRKDMDKTGDGKNKRKSAAQLLGGLRTDMPTVVIEHEPYDLDELQKNGADLVLSGHTHGGQLWPGNILVRFMYKNAAGQKKVGGMETITTAGIGTYGPPLRLGCAAEIPVISLYY